MTPELSRPVSVSKIRPEGPDVRVRATKQECAALAARMGLPAIHSLECDFNLTVEDDEVSIFARLRLRARVTRVCVISTDEFEATVSDDAQIRFVPAGLERDDADPEVPEEIPYENDTIDLGEAAAEQLGLALDPYPRIDGATLLTIEDDEGDSPFSVLARRTGPG